MNDTTTTKLINFILAILTIATKKPDLLLLQETGKTREEFPALGYPNRVSSFDFIENNEFKISENEHRRSRLYGPSTIQAPDELQLLPDCSTIIDNYSFSRIGGNRLRSIKIMILNAYRNHKIPKTVFKEKIEKIIEKSATEFGAEAFVIMGDMNDTGLNLKDLVEIPHDGHHRHRPGSRLTNIDKVFVSQNLFDLGARVLVLPTTENTGSEDESIGHKTIVLFINEKIEQKRTITTTSMTKFEKIIQEKFNNTVTNDIISRIKRQRSLYIERQQHPQPPDARVEIQNKFYESVMEYDPAKNFLDIITSAMKDSEITFKRTQAIQMSDLEGRSIEVGPQSIKAFCRFYSIIKENLLVENEYSSLNESKKLKPTTIKLVQNLEKKLNRGHEAVPEKVTGFINSIPSDQTKITPDYYSTDDIKSSLSKINKTKTPWLNGVSPNVLLSTLQKSNNAVKILREILNSTLLMGRLYSSMVKDRIFFLFKNGDIDEAANYRPICIDNPITKIGCHLYNKFILKYVKKFMDPRNYSYTEKKSTNMAIIKACNIVQQIRERGNYAAIFCTDCSGAFETIQSSLIEGALDSQLQDNDKCKPIKWISSYLKDKEIYAPDEEGNEIQLQRHRKTVGSGQGSMISPKLWLIQSSASLFWLDEAKITFIEKFEGLAIDFFLLAFADDNICIVELDLLTELRIKEVYLCNMRLMVDEFLFIWERILIDCGMLLNQTKTEILLPNLVDETRYPKFKSSIKWLGIHLCLDKDGYLVSDVDKNIQMIRTKTFDKFNEITLLTTAVTVKLRVFTLYVESIINFCLIVILVAGTKFAYALNRFQVLQNNFLRRLTMTARSSAVDELHEHLGVYKVDFKLSRMAASEWDKLDETVNYKPLLKSQKDKSPMDRMYELRHQFIEKFKIKKRHTFDLDKYKSWKEKMDRRLLRVTKDRRKIKEHLRETAKLRKILEERLNQN